MALNPNSLGAGVRLESWGLRQHKDIIEPPSQIPFITNNFQVTFYSPYGEVISTLTPGLEEGLKLNIKWNEVKLGGLEKFEITMKRRTEIPFFSGMVCRFTINNVSWGVGELRDYPETDVAGEIITISGIGYSQKLKNKKISYTFETKNVKQMIETMAPEFTELNINYNSVKVSVPVVTLDKVEFNEKSLFSAMERLVYLLNYQYQDTQFVFGVDEYQDFYMFGIDKAQTIDQFFEGVHFQFPEVELETSDLVNKVDMHRTIEGNTKETEYVLTELDQDSIDEYTLAERKVIVSDFTSDDVMLRMAQAIVEEKKNPRKRITLNEMRPLERYKWAYYLISNKLTFQKFTLSECSSFTGWTTSTSNSTLEITTERVFTGRKCFKWSFGTSAQDIDNIEFSTEIFGPKKIIVYVRYTYADGANLSLSVTGNPSNRLKGLIAEAGGSEVGPIVLDDGSFIEVETYDTPFALVTKEIELTSEGYIFANDWIKFELDVSDFFSLSSISMQCKNEGTQIALVDRLDVITNSYFQNKLNLEEVEYEVTDNTVKAIPVFGNRVINIISELNKVNEKNFNLFDVFTKQ